MAATMKQVAEELGVSIPAVSQALHGTGGNTRVSEEVRLRIIETAASIGYRPNSMARGTRLGRTQAAALILGADPERSHLPSTVQDAICARLATLGMHLVQSRMADEDLTSEKAMPRILQELVVDGLLVNYTHGSPRRLNELIARFNIPAVWLNHKREADCVYPDDFQAAHLATRHLLDLGHRRIAMVDFMHWQGSDRAGWHYSVEDRHAGYAAAMSAAGLTPQRVLAETPDLACRHLARALLSGLDRPTAILTYHPHNAFTMGLVAAELGLVVPRDLSLVSFNDHGEMFLDMPMTLSAIPAVAIGVAGVEMLLAKIKAPAAPLKPMCIPFLFDRGATTAPPAATARRPHGS